MAKGNFAHGECADCGFIGDLYFVDEDGESVGICPECGCTTPLKDMADVPGEKTKA